MAHANYVNPAHPEQPADAPADAPAPPGEEAHASFLAYDALVCHEHASFLRDALACHVQELHAESKHDSAFSVLVGEGHELRVSIVPNCSNPGGIVETHLFDSDGTLVWGCMLHEENLADWNDCNGTLRYYVGGGDHVIEIAAYIKALREHFGWVADSDQDSDRDSEQKDSDKGDSDQEVLGDLAVEKFVREINEHTTKEGEKTRAVLVGKILKQVKNIKNQLCEIKTELRARTRCRDDEIRAMAERMRGLEELVHAQQEQMRLMSESMALSFAFIDKQVELNALTASK